MTTFYIKTNNAEIINSLFTALRLKQRSFFLKWAQSQKHSSGMKSDVLACQMKSKQNSSHAAFINLRLCFRMNIWRKYTHQTEQGIQLKYS